MKSLDSIPKGNFLNTEWDEIESKLHVLQATALTITPWPIGLHSTSNRCSDVLLSYFGGYLLAPF